MDSCPVLFAYCENDQQPDKVLRAILRQLLQLKPAWKREDLKRAYKIGVPFSAEEISQQIKVLINNYKSVIIVIDALDACAKGSGIPSYTYIKVLHELTSIMRTPSYLVKVLVSTWKDNSEVESVLNGVNVPPYGCILPREISTYHISADRQPRDDIERFIKRKVENWKPVGELYFKRNQKQNQEVVQEGNQGSLPDAVSKEKQSVINAITANAGRK
jgi:hypothetical protein